MFRRPALLCSSLTSGSQELSIHPPSPRSTGPRSQVSGRRLALASLLPRKRLGLATGTRSPFPANPSGSREPRPGLLLASPSRPASRCPSSPGPPFFLRFPVSLSLFFPLSSLPRWPKWIPPLNDLESPSTTSSLCSSPLLRPCLRGIEGEGPGGHEGFGDVR